MASTIFKGVIHGKTIELEQEPGLPDGLTVGIELHPLEVMRPDRSSVPIPPVETWMDRLIFDSAVHPTERIVKGTRLEAETLVAEIEAGGSDEDLRQSHPELTAEDLAALRNYALAPVGLRQSFGAWAEDAEELDKYLEWNRQQRKVGRREIDE